VLINTDHAEAARQAERLPGKALDDPLVPSVAERALDGAPDHDRAERVVVPTAGIGDEVPVKPALLPLYPTRGTPCPGWRMRRLGELAPRALRG